MAGNTGTTQACAACKYQRRKCSADCPLAPYFPPDQPKQFINVHRLFGVSNVLRILKQIDSLQKSDAMKSILYEAEAWEKDPVHGCFGVITMLQSQVERLQEELEQARSQIFLLQHQHKQQQLHSLVSASLTHPMEGQWLYPYLQSAHLGMEGCSGVRPGNYDVKPGYNTKFEFDQQDLTPTYQEQTEEYQFASSVDSHLKRASTPLEHVPEQDLKNAAALFTLTSNQ